MNKQEDIRKNRQKMRLSVQNCINKVQSRSQLRVNINNQQEGDIQAYSSTRKRSATTNIIKYQQEQQKISKSIDIKNTFDQLFIIRSKLGQGYQSVVYLCQQKSTGINYAVKQIRCSEIQTFNNLKQQYTILKYLDYPSIVKAHYLYVNHVTSQINMVFEYCSYPNLRVYMDKKKRLKEGQTAKILQKIIQALEYLHGQGVAHRDIKPQNIMYDQQKQIIKLIDFQIAKKRKNKDKKLQMWTNTGTIFYKAPQMFKGTYNEQIDIWAMGIMAYQMLTGFLPWSSDYHKQIIKQIQQKNLNLQKQAFTIPCQQFLKNVYKKIHQKDQQVNNHQETHLYQNTQEVVVKHQ